MILEQTRESVAYWKAVEKARNMTDESLLAVWKALGNSNAWGDGCYDAYITLDEWAEIVLSEIEKRKLKV